MGQVTLSKHFVYLQNEKCCIIMRTNKTVPVIYNLPQSKQM